MASTDLGYDVVPPDSHAAKRIEFTLIEEVEALSDVVTAYLREAIVHG